MPLMAIKNKLTQIQKKPLLKSQQENIKNQKKETQNKDIWYMYI